MFIKISSDADAHAGRMNSFYDRLSRIGAPVAVALLAMIPLGFLLYFVAAPIIGIVNMKDRTHACFESENNALRSMLIALIDKREFNPADVETVKRYRVRYGGNMKHPCYMVNFGQN
jgi:hypothetical protein